MFLKVKKKEKTRANEKQTNKQTCCIIIPQIFINNFSSVFPTNQGKIRKKLLNSWLDTSVKTSHSIINAQDEQILKFNYYSLTYNLCALCVNSQIVIKHQRARTNKQTTTTKQSIVKSISFVGQLEAEIFTQTSSFHY